MLGFIILSVMACCCAAQEGKFTVNKSEHILIALKIGNMGLSLDYCHLSYNPFIIIFVKGVPTFTISGYSRSNVPEMTVAFENGQTHEMILEPYSESPCNFIGELKSEPGSSVGVTGCLDNPDDKMYITLLSDENSLSFAYIMDYNGEVTSDENPFKTQTGYLYFL